MKAYVNKLVRNNVIPVIDKQGKEFSYKVLDDKEYFQELKIKLQEKMTNFLIKENTEEMADIIEILYAIIEHKGYSMEEVELLRFMKKSTRGSFDKKYFLEWVEENN